MEHKLITKGARKLYGHIDHPNDGGATYSVAPRTLVEVRFPDRDDLNKVINPQPGRVLLRVDHFGDVAWRVESQDHQ